MTKRERAGRQRPESFSSFDQRRRQIVTLHCLSLARGKKDLSESRNIFALSSGGGGGGAPFSPCVTDVVRSSTMRFATRIMKRAQGRNNRIKCPAQSHRQSISVSQMPKINAPDAQTQRRFSFADRDAHTWARCKTRIFLFLSRSSAVVFPRCLNLFSPYFAARANWIVSGLLNIWLSRFVGKPTPLPGGLADGAEKAACLPARARGTFQDELVGIVVVFFLQPAESEKREKLRGKREETIFACAFSMPAPSIRCSFQVD